MNLVSGLPLAAAAVASVVGGGGGYVVLSLAWAVLVVTAVSREPVRRWGPTVPLATVAITVAPAVVVRPVLSTPALLAAFALTMVPLVALGLLLRRLRGTRSARHRAEREARAAGVRREQRLRIARDLHDVLAHHVSGMAVQAAAAQTLAGTRPDLVESALQHVRETGRSTLDAMPALLDALAEPPAGGRWPAEGESLATADIEPLAGPLRAAGAPVSVRVTGGPVGPSRVAREARWILQEALTNVLRHAGPSPTEVRVDRRDGAVSVSVADQGPVDGHRAGPGGGFGLLGMRERVAELGGSLDAGPAGPGWRVRARIPVPDRHAAHR